MEEHWAIAPKTNGSFTKLGHCGTLGNCGTFAPKTNWDFVEEHWENCEI